MNAFEPSANTPNAPMLSPDRGVGIIPAVVQRHAEEAAILYTIRTTLCAAPHVKLHHLRGFDDRLAAHLDGLAIAGDQSWTFCASLLGSPESGAVFAAAVRAIDERHQVKLDHLFAIVQAVPDTLRQLISALGWQEPAKLTGLVTQLLKGDDSTRRLVGVAACGLHRVDPGLLRGHWMKDVSSEVRARSLRIAGELGLRETASRCGAASEDADDDCAFWGAWAAVLLGDRMRPVEVLERVAFAPTLHRNRAFRLVLQTVSGAAAHRLLQSLYGDPNDLRWVIQGSGIAGDPSYIPWLISHMSKDRIAQLSGEAFSLITGADLALLDLERKPPEDFESGPNDDPDDPNVDMDPDDGLPWPDPDKVKKWWDANHNRFQPGQRYFMGAPVTRAHCIDVLKNGYQRQRILAAHYLCLLDPGTPLFNTSAPAWRQQKLLAQMV